MGRTRSAGQSSGHALGPAVTIFGFGRSAVAFGLALACATPAFSAQSVFAASVYATNGAHIAGGSYGAIVAGAFSDSDGANARNFTSLSRSTSAADSVARTLSQTYAARTATGTLTTGQYTPGDATLQGTSSGTNIFYIDGSTYSRLYALTFSGIGSGAVVNVSGGSLTNFLNISYGSLLPSQVLFNFYEATTVSMGGMTIAGSLLAPDARVQIQGGSVAGSVVANSFYSEGATIGGQGFVDNSATTVTAIPEPATWTMLLLGFCAIGFVLRRKRTITVAQPCVTALAAGSSRLAYAAPAVRG
nr:choice-of-anchor A family protein [Sphingomonas sp. TREG-RG-20F-R18-01]